MDHAVMPRCVLGERERFPHHPPDPLAQGVVPALHVRGFARLLAHAPVVGLRKHAGVGLPEVAEGAAAAVRLGYPAPKASGHSRRPRQAPARRRAAPGPGCQPPSVSAGVFFNHAARVGRDTPKTRQTPRRLASSWYARRISSLRPSL